MVHSELHLLQIYMTNFVFCLTMEFIVILPSTVEWNIIPYVPGCIITATATAKQQQQPHIRIHNKYITVLKNLSVDSVSTKMQYDTVLLFIGQWENMWLWIWNVRGTAERGALSLWEEQEGRQNLTEVHAESSIEGKKLWRVL